MNAALLISHLNTNQGLTHAQIAQRTHAHTDDVAAWARGEDCPPERREQLRQMAGLPDSGNPAENPDAPSS